ncbi:MAG: N-acetylglucosamine-6-phosphate deacetylase [Ruminococcaceae bacterium]|nr:N-acetylglucosamine-6-phosphate deacetylase [Oscillospiraceae bacterium]
MLKVLKNANLYIDGKFIKKDILIDEKIVEIGDNLKAETEIDLSGKYVTPGFIDIHIHGRGGVDAVEDCGLLSKNLAKLGVTSFLPTTLTLSEEDTLKALNKLADYIENQDKSGAEALGIYSEGIFFSKLKCGAQNPDYIKEEIDFSLVEKMLEASRGYIKIMAFAPENKGSEELSDYLSKRGIRASMGHTNALEKDIKPCIEKGLSGVTHLYNGMYWMNHLELGAGGVGVFDDRLYAEIITDGYHVNKEFLNILFKFKPIDKILFISDNVHLSGLPKGKGSMGGVPVIIEEDRLIVDQSEGFSLAGSCLKLCDSIKNASKMTGISIEELLACVTKNPAEYVGVYNRKGSIEVGKDSDLNIFDKEFNLLKTYIKGEEV